MEESPLNDTKYTTPGVSSLDGEETARLHRAKGPLRKAQKRKRDSQALRSTIPPLSSLSPQRHSFGNSPSNKKREPSSILAQGFSHRKRQLPTLPLLRSTIGVVGLNFSVRNGKRWNPNAITTLISLTSWQLETLKNELKL